MIRRVSVAVAGLAWFAAAACGASTLRLRALGSIDGMVDDEVSALNLSNLGNPAGLAWLSRGMRVDESLTKDTSTQEETNVLGRVSRMDSAYRVGLPGGVYEGFTWIGERNAWQIGLDGGFDLTDTTLQPVGSDRSESATTFFSAEARFVLKYARRITDRLTAPRFISS